SGSSICCRKGYMTMKKTSLLWVAVGLWALSPTTQAQWNVRNANAPRTPDGKVDMAGPVPRVNAKPDLSGIWQVESDRPQNGLFGLGESPNSKYFGSITADFKPDEQPLTPLGQEMFRKNRQGTGTRNPQLYCLPDGVPHAELLPEPFKIANSSGEILFL